MKPGRRLRFLRLRPGLAAILRAHEEYAIGLVAAQRREGQRHCAVLELSQRGIAIVFRPIKPASSSEVRSTAPKNRKQRAIPQPHHYREITSTTLHHDDRAAAFEAERSEPDQDPT